MTTEDTNRPITDEELVAYLDGELALDRRAALEGRLAEEPALRRRLERLEDGGRPFRQAFDVLLQDAPADRLEAMLDAQPGAAARKVRRPSRTAWIAAAAAILLFAAGIGLGSLIRPLAPPPAQTVAEDTAEGGEDWRQAVAVYLSLYTAETLASLPDDDALRMRQLAAVSDKLGLTLTPERVALPALQFKRAQLLDYEGEALAQLAYLDPEFGPVAFCIIAEGDESEAQRTERRLGMNIVYWADRGYYFMLIGRAPAEQLRPLADRLAERISS